MMVSTTPTAYPMNALLKYWLSLPLETSNLNANATKIPANVQMKIIMTPEEKALSTALLMRLALLKNFPILKPCERRQINYNIQKILYPKRVKVIYHTCYPPDVKSH